MPVGCPKLDNMKEISAADVFSDGALRILADYQRILSLLSSSGADVEGDEITIRYLPAIDSFGHLTDAQNNASSNSCFMRSVPEVKNVSLYQDENGLFNLLSTKLIDLEKNVILMARYFLKDISIRDNIIVSVGRKKTPQNGYVYTYQLLDMATSCLYESSEVIPDLDDKREVKKYFRRMVISANEYLSKNDIQQALSDVPRKKISYPDGYPLFLEPNTQKEKDSVRVLARDFSHVNVRLHHNCILESGYKPTEFVASEFCYDQKMFEETAFSPIVVGGVIRFIRIIPSSLNIKKEDKGVSIEIPAWGGTKIDPAVLGLKLIRRSGNDYVYGYTDKYNNVIEITLTNQWWNLSDKKIIISVDIFPELALSDSNVSEMTGINIDLTRIGYGDYKDVIIQPSIPKMAQLDEGTAVYTACKIPRDGDAYGEIDNIHSQVGTAIAELLFGEKDIVGAVVLFNIAGPIGGIAPSQFASGIILLNTNSLDGYGTPFHETIHVIDRKYRLSEHEAIISVVEKLKRRGTVPPVYCKLTEVKMMSGYCQQQNLDWFNTVELIPEFLQSVMSEDLIKNYESLSQEERNDYILLLEAFKIAIAENIPNGKDLPIYKKIDDLMTVFLNQFPANQ